MIFNSFKDTIILKKSSELQKKYDALLALKKEYPNNDKIREELYLVKRGLYGEKEIEYQLLKSNLGMYVIHDLNIEYDNLKAQIDYIVITKAYCYFIECKNLVGNITVNDKGDFIREYIVDGKKIKKGMYSPIRQVEAQRDVYKKIWNNLLSKNKVINNIKKMLSEKNFSDTYRTLVVVANNEAILNTKKAPKDIKYSVIKADALIRKIQYDIDHSDKEVWSSKKEMEKWANSFLKLDFDQNIDYYEMYKEKYYNTEILEKKLKNQLIEFRKVRSKEMQIPAYYVFNNEELEKLLKVKPKSVQELRNENILSDVKINTHGKEIIKIIVEQ